MSAESPEAARTGQVDWEMAPCPPLGPANGLARLEEVRYYCGMAYAAATGVLHGNTITLDAPVPPLDGQRVRITIALDDQDLALAVDDQARLWDEWARRGPQGPIEDDEEPEFP